MATSASDKGSPISVEVSAHAQFPSTEVSIHKAYRWEILLLKFSGLW